MRPLAILVDVGGDVVAVPEHHSNICRDNSNNNIIQQYVYIYIYIYIYMLVHYIINLTIIVMSLYLLYI